MQGACPRSVEQNQSPVLYCDRCARRSPALICDDMTLQELCQDCSDRLSRRRQTAPGLKTLPKERPSS